MKYCPVKIALLITGCLLFSGCAVPPNGYQPYHPNGYIPYRPYPSHPNGYVPSPVAQPPIVLPVYHPNGYRPYHPAHPVHPLHPNGYRPYHPDITPHTPPVIVYEPDKR